LENPTGVEKPGFSRSYPDRKKNGQLLNSQRKHNSEDASDPAGY